MDYSFWKQRWDSGRTGFHQSDVNRHLTAHLDVIAGPHATGVLVPLCGKTRDLTFLSSHFSRVVGVEFVEDAVRDYFVERGVPYQVDSVSGLPRYTGGGVTLLSADFHAITLAETGPVNRVFDRASMIALPRETRPRYAAHLVSLMPPAGRILLVTMSYDQHLIDGPPFSVPEDEVHALYHHTCDIERLSRQPATSMPPRFAEAEVQSTVWLLTKR